MSSATPQGRTVLIVDDTPANLSLLNEVLRGQYRLKLANNGVTALKLAMANPPDLVLLDIMMPEMDGFEVCRQLKAHPATAEVPVIFVTAVLEPEQERLGFELGAVDYIHKPFNPPVVQARVKTHMNIKAWQDFMGNHSAWLQQEVTRRVDQVLKLQNATVQVMVAMAEFRDTDTGSHIRRTQEYVRILGTWLAANTRYRSRLNDETVANMAQAAPLHDIGKVAIPDHILLKPGRLDADEFRIMRTHTVHGHAILVQARREMGADNRLLDYAAEITRHHHERWDGAGYPDGLAAEALPLSARLMAVADVYDATRFARPYKKPFTHERSRELIVQGRGSHFDPEVVDAFLACEAEIRTIAGRLEDQ